jgi:hypothetical protein
LRMPRTVGIRPTAVYGLIIRRSSVKVPLPQNN